jgi:hypothetical protein
MELVMPPMLNDDFQTAATSAQSRVGKLEWGLMMVREQAKAVYAELQRNDAQRVQARHDLPRGKPGGRLSMSNRRSP